MIGFVGVIGAMDARGGLDKAVCRMSRKRALPSPVVMQCYQPGQDASPSELTAGEALRSWQIAKENGEVPEEFEPSRAVNDSRFKVLFVCRDNTSTSVVAHAILGDLIRRRKFGQYLTCDSAGYRVTDGTRPAEEFCQALVFRHKLDIREHAARTILPSDIDAYNLIICMDTKTRNNVLYMKLGNPGVGKDEEMEKKLNRKIRLLSEYCTINKLKKMEFPSGQYRQAAMRMMLSTVADGCSGLLMRLSKGVEKTKQREQREKNSGSPQSD